jgi:hypothetical protein
MTPEALSRRALGIPVDVPDTDDPAPLFDPDAEGLADAVDRHPANDRPQP